MKHFITALFLLPFLSFSQTNNSWQLFIGAKKIASGVAGKEKDVEIASTNSKTIKVKYLPAFNKKSWTNTLIIMNTNRIELERKILTVKNNSLVITKKNLLEYKKLIVCVISKPSDPKQAAKVRVGTMPLVAIKLID